MPEQSSSPASPVVPRLAAAVALARTRPEGGIEVFMVRRHVQSEFMPDVYVFPGGSVKATDREAEQIPGLCALAGEGETALGSGLRVAALRELFEEAGVLLAYHRGAPMILEVEAVGRFAAHRAELSAGKATLGSIAAREGLRLATDALVHWAHWITPEAMPKRFDTRFFLAEAPPEQVAHHDEIEVTDSAWVAPEEALAACERGEFPMAFATIRQMHELTGAGDVAALRARFSGHLPQTIMPVVTPAPNGGFLIHIPGILDEPIELASPMRAPGTGGAPGRPGES
jgi:8-oxo-dGTP pyrophosphatase MutT (NUDIX family)